METWFSKVGVRGMGGNQDAIVPRLNDFVKPIYKKLLPLLFQPSCAIFEFNEHGYL
jgi:hypothetical protein